MTAVQHNAQRFTHSLHHTQYTCPQGVNAIDFSWSRHVWQVTSCCGGSSGTAVEYICMWLIPASPTLRWNQYEIAALSPVDTKTLKFDSSLKNILI